jgi:bacterioferritin-associated ferredoxin
MIVCHCNGISDRAVRRAIREGASSRREIARACHAGSGCGGCHPFIQQLLERERRKTERSVSAAIGDLAPSH